MLLTAFSGPRVLDGCHAREMMDVATVLPTREYEKPLLPSS